MCEERLGWERGPKCCGCGTFYRPDSARSQEPMPTGSQSQASVPPLDQHLHTLPPCCPGGWGLPVTALACPAARICLALPERTRSVLGSIYWDTFIGQMLWPEPQEGAAQLPARSCPPGLPLLALPTAFEPWTPKYLQSGLLLNAPSCEPPVSPG